MLQAASLLQWSSLIVQYQLGRYDLLTPVIASMSKNHRYPQTLHNTKDPLALPRLSCIGFFLYRPHFTPKILHIHNSEEAPELYLDSRSLRAYAVKRVAVIERQRTKVGNFLRAAYTSCNLVYFQSDAAHGYRAWECPSAPIMFRGRPHLL